MKTILEKLFDVVDRDYKIVRVNVREDENYGTAIVENPSGTPQGWEYNSRSGNWEYFYSHLEVLACLKEYKC